MICTISKHRAQRAGYVDALMLDWQGRVAECTGATVFFARGGTLHAPIADSFLSGITRETVIELAQARGIGFEERRIMPDELYAPGSLSQTMIEAYARTVRGGRSPCSSRGTRYRDGSDHPVHLSVRQPLA